MDVLAARSDAVVRRIRVARALRTGATTFAFGIAGVALAVAASELGWLARTDLTIAIALGLAVPLGLTIASAARALPRLLGAELLDRAYDLHGRITGALELEADPSPLARLAVRDAIDHARNVSPARAFPIRAPMHARALVLACAALAVAATLDRPAPESLPTPPPSRLAPLLVHADDLALEHEALQRLEGRTDPTPELRRAIDDTNELLEQLQDRSVDRTEALRQLAELTARLERARPTSLTMREEQLAALGDRLGRGETTSDLAQALRAHDAAAAQRALRALAERVRSGDLSRDERRRLQEALAEARTEQEGDLLHDEGDRSEPRTQEEQERLLEQERESVEQTRREIAEQQEAERELERLERELDEAGEQLDDSQSDGSDAADSLDQAAEDLNRTARDQASEEQMQQLAEQLRQLREMIRRQREQQGGNGEDGEGGEGQGRGSQGGQAGRMDRFVLRAGGEGEGGTEGTSIGVRQSGGSEGEGHAEGSEGEGGQDENGTPGGTSGSAQGAEGEGSGGQGEGEEPQQMLVLGNEPGESNATLELPGMGGSGTGRERGAGDGEGGERRGAGHDPGGASLDDPTDRQGDHRTVAVQGQDQGVGPSRSEVIRGGAARGFASRDYERVYAEYEAHAERAIEEDEIPPGYRFYVRRYFDLIRPRD